MECLDCEDCVGTGGLWLDSWVVDCQLVCIGLRPLRKGVGKVGLQVIESNLHGCQVTDKAFKHRPGRGLRTTMVVVKEYKSYVVPVLSSTPLEGRSRLGEQESCETGDKHFGLSRDSSLP